MRVEYCDDILVVYLKLKKVGDIEELCKDIISRLEKYFNIKLKGFYDVNIYIDSNYGVVLEFNKEDISSYIDYDKIDVHVNKIDTIFLYEVFDILDINITSFYYYENKYYIKTDNVDNNILEYVKVVYKDTIDIFNNGKIIHM